MKALNLTHVKSENMFYKYLHVSCAVSEQNTLSQVSNRFSVVQVSGENTHHFKCLNEVLSRSTTGRGVNRATVVNMKRLN